MTAERHGGLAASAMFAVLAACGAESPTPAPTPMPTPSAPRAATMLAPTPVRYACAPELPAAACAQLKAEPTPAAADIVFAPCGAGDTAHVGAWHYALIAPSLSPIESISSAELAAMWRGDPKAMSLAVTADAKAALASRLGAPGAALVELVAGARPELDANHGAIVAVDDLQPAWHVVAIDGHHPLELDTDASPLTVPLCARGAHPPAPAPALAPITNFDRAQLTVIAMTGTTALTRLTSALLDAKGATYPARDVAPWFTGADFVHVSNEVSFVAGCTQGTPGMAFCSRESYIALLEAIHTNIIELTGSHLADYGTRWVPHTLDMYAARGWRWFGGGHDQVEGQRTLELDHHGNRFAFVGCNAAKTDAHIVWDVPGVSACDMRRLAWQIADLRARGVFPIVSIQHEEVYVHAPPDRLVRDFRQLAAAGAGIVFGSQSHVAHPWEQVRGAYVHYGAGNFFFDQEAALTRDGVADRFYLYRGRLLAVGHLYTRLEENGRPRPLTDRERAGFLHELAIALAGLSRVDAWSPPAPVALGPARPDSLLIGNQQLFMYVFAPAAAPAPTSKPAPAPLVICLHRADLRGGALDRVLSRGRPAALAGGAATPDGAVVAVPHLPAGATWTRPRVEAIRAYLIAKYAVDAARVTLERE